MPHNLTPEELRKAAVIAETPGIPRCGANKMLLFERAWRAFRDASPPMQDWCRAEADRIEKESKEKDGKSF